MSDDLEGYCSSEKPKSEEEKRKSEKLRVLTKKFYTECLDPNDIDSERKTFAEIQEIATPEQQRDILFSAFLKER